MSWRVALPAVGLLVEGSRTLGGLQGPQPALPRPCCRVYASARATTQPQRGSQLQAEGPPLLGSMGFHTPSYSTPCMLPFSAEPQWKRPTDRATLLSATKRGERRQARSGARRNHRASSCVLSCHRLTADIETGCLCGNDSIAHWRRVRESKRSPSTKVRRSAGRCALPSLATHTTLVEVAAD